MTKAEILTNYRWLVLSAAVIRKQTELLESIGGPAQVHGLQLTGMPKGTNEPGEAQVQQYWGYVELLRQKAGEISELCNGFEGILQSMEPRAQVVCRMYYALAMTDEAIAKEVHLDWRTVNGIRNEAVRGLDNSGENS